MLPPSRISHLNPKTKKRTGDRLCLQRIHSPAGWFWSVIWRWFNGREVIQVRDPRWWRCCCEYLSSLINFSFEYDLFMLLLFLLHGLLLFWPIYVLFSTFFVMRCWNVVNWLVQVYFVFNQFFLVLMEVELEVSFPRSVLHFYTWFSCLFLEYITEGFLSSSSFFFFFFFLLICFYLALAEV